MSYNAKNYTEQGGSVTHIGGKLKFETGSTMEGAPLPAATAAALGAVKVGSGLSVTTAGVLSIAPAASGTLGGVKPGTGVSVAADGALSVAPADNQAASSAADVAGLLADFNALLTKLKAAGLMAADAT